MNTPSPAAAGWCALLRRATVSGGTAAAVSALTAAQRARSEGARPGAPIDDVTHAIWPGEAERTTRPSLRHTALGLAIHTGASVFWALGFEALRSRASRPSLGREMAAAAAISATAWCVDYHVVPKRFTPGFEAHLSGRSLAWVYGAIAAGLVAGACLERRTRGAP